MHATEIHLSAQIGEFVTGKNCSACIKMLCWVNLESFHFSLFVIFYKKCSIIRNSYLFIYEQYFVFMYNILLSIHKSNKKDANIFCQFLASQIWRKHETLVLKEDSSLVVFGSKCISVVVRKYCFHPDLKLASKDYAADQKGSKGWNVFSNPASVMVQFSLSKN